MTICPPQIGQGRKNAKDCAGNALSRASVSGNLGANGQPMIDPDLPFDVARQFLSDCPAIGLRVQARLRGR